MATWSTCVPSGHGPCIGVPSTSWVAGTPGSGSARPARACSRVTVFGVLRKSAMRSGYAGWLRPLRAGHRSLTAGPLLVALVQGHDPVVRAAQPGVDGLAEQLGCGCGEERQGWLVGDLEVKASLPAPPVGEAPGPEAGKPVREPGTEVQS